MSTNDFQVFAGGSGANVLSQAAYLAYVNRTVGFQPGVADSNAANKVLRQASIISAMVAQFIVDNALVDAIDDGTITNLKTAFQAAIQAFITAAVSGLAPKASPALTGTPTAPTAAASSNTTQIATTAFVQAAIDAALASYLPKNNPTFTGTLTGPSFNKAP